MKDHKKLLLAAMVGAFALAGCSETGSGGSPGGAPALRTGSYSDEQACLAAVGREAGNGDVSVISSDTSQAGTVVMVNVGGANAPWRCLIARGVVQEVMFTGSEGAA
ncbi:MAG TPA: hypothetical protein PKE65_01220 [Rhizobiaceae bacterium]|nr:hypothetical protein [Rhizobiaceae bacterium]